MTPAQVYAAIAALLNITAAEAEQLCNHIMAMALGRNTTESASWRITPPVQRNDLQTPEKMPTRVLNGLVTNEAGVRETVQGFDYRFNEVAGNHYPGQPDEEAFEELGMNLIQAALAVKQALGEIDFTDTEFEGKTIIEILTEIKELIDGGDLGGSYTPTAEEKLVLESGITAVILQAIQDNLSSLGSRITILESTTIKQSELVPMTDNDLDEIFEEVFGVV